MSGQTNNQGAISAITKSVESYLAAVKAFAIQSGMDAKTLKALDKSILAKGGVLGIAQIAIATNEEGAAGGIDKAASVGLGIVAGIFLAPMVATGAATALVVLGAGWIVSATYDSFASSSVKSFLNNQFNDDVTPEQKQQQFNTIVDGASSEFKQAFEAESGQTLEQVKQQTNFNTNTNAP